MNYQNNFLFFLLFLVCSSSFYSCISEESKKEKERLKQAELDSIALLYEIEQAHHEIDKVMRNLHTQKGFNGNVLVAKQGKIVYQNSFGWANHLLKDSLKIDSKFELASVSKPFTAIAILKLVDEEKINLQQTVNDFYPDFPYTGITIKQLLSHRSGLPNYVYFSESVWKERSKAMTNQDVMQLLIKYKPARYGAPDGRFHYNNSNFMVLASIIEKVVNQDFSAYMKEQIFDPLGMKNTAFYSKADYEKIPTNVVGHDKIWRRSVVQNYQDGPVGDKGMYSTVQDLFLFDIALRQGRVLKQELLDSAYMPRNDAKNGWFSYGYGWRTFSPPGRPMVYHTGWWHGFKNLYVRDLKNEITLIFLSNMANESLSELDEIYKIMEMPVLRQSAYNQQGDLL